VVPTEKLGINIMKLLLTIIVGLIIISTQSFAQTNPFAGSGGQTINQLPPAHLPLTGTELVPCWQSNSTRKCQISTFPGTGGGGINQLLGPVTTPSGTGPQTTTITPTGVPAGSYTLGSFCVTVLASGQISNIVSGSCGGAFAFLGTGTSGTDGLGTGTSSTDVLGVM
jgi:hypothetical protein